LVFVLVEERLDCTCEYSVEPEKGMESGSGAKKEEAEGEWVMEVEEEEWVEEGENVDVYLSERKEPRS
jgi:molybdopterin biosynthesis enzyme